MMSIRTGRVGGFDAYNKDGYQTAARMTATNPFPPDALETNRHGRLTDAQRRNLGALAGYNRRNGIRIALFLIAGAAIVLLLARRDAPVLLRYGTVAGALALAAFLVARSLSGSDALTRDLVEARVQFADGAIRKRRVSAGRAPNTYYLDLDGETFKIGRSTYEWLPDAGRVRVYFLPRSRGVVNVEILSSAPTTMLAAAFDAVTATLDRSPQPPPTGARDPRPLADAVVGTSTNGVIRVTFAADGTLALRMLASERKGHWSVDATGRLRADITGGEQTVDAWIAGDRLTVVLEGEGLTLTRESG